mgnify:CR=1 FL=1|jgi:hypothetical protein
MDHPDLDKNQNFAKVVEWYGSKEAALSAAQGHPGVPGIMTSYQKRMGAIQQKIVGKAGTDVHSLKLAEGYIWHSERTGLKRQCRCYGRHL